MSTNVNAAKERLARYNGQKTENTEKKINYKDLIWKPSEGLQTVRIVPAKWNRADPIKIVFMHQYKVFKKFVLALTNWGEKDPAVELTKALFNEQDPDLKEESADTARKINPVKNFFVPVIVRGEEHKGVRLWQYTAIGTDKQLCAILGKPEKYGDITDVYTGRDLEVTGIKVTKSFGERKPITFIETQIEAALDKTPLSDDVKLVEKWLNEQTDPLDINKKYTYDEIKSMLYAYLIPDEAETVTSDDQEEPTEKTNDTKTVSEDDTTPFEEDVPNEELKEVEEVKPVVVKKPVVSTVKKTTEKVTEKVTVKNPTKPNQTIKGGAKTKVSAADLFDKHFN